MFNTRTEFATAPPFRTRVTICCCCLSQAASQPEPQPALDSPATKLKKVSVQRAVPAGAFGALVEILMMMMAGAADADTAAKGPSSTTTILGLFQAPSQTRIRHSAC